MTATENRAHLIRHRIMQRCKRLQRGREHIEQKVWGACHDLVDDAIDMDDRVNILVKERPWEQLHNANDKANCILYSVVD